MELPQWFSGKDLPAMQETQVRSLEDPREECMADHSSILARKIPWREEPASYSPRGSRESDMPEGTEHTYRLKCTIFTDRDGLFIDTHKRVPPPTSSYRTSPRDSLRPFPVGEVL